MWKCGKVAEEPTQRVTPRIFKSGRPEVFCKKGALKNFVKFTEKYLYQSLFFNNGAGCIKILKHAETFHANKGYKLEIGNFAVFKTGFRGTFFKRYLNKYEAWDYPTFYVKMNYLNIIFYMT